MNTGRCLGVPASGYTGKLGKAADILRSATANYSGWLGRVCLKIWKQVLPSEKCTVVSSLGSKRSREERCTPLEEDHVMFTARHPLRNIVAARLSVSTVSDLSYLYALHASTHSQCLTPERIRGPPCCI